jgi:ELWxxDGT repeat protein
LVFDINPGNQSSDPTELTNVNGTLFFSASDGTSGTDHGRELWSSDETTGVTQMVLDINPGNQGSDPAELTDVDGTLYFAATDGTHGTELWTSDGTAVGTNMVLDIMPGPGDSTPRFFNNYDGSLVFAADDGIHGYEPWFSDGTAAGTYLLKDINPSGSSFPINFARVNPLFFLADGGNGYELWKSDGTPEGTVRVSDVGASDVAGSEDTNSSGTSDSSASSFLQSSLAPPSSRLGDDFSTDGKDRIDESQAPRVSADRRGFTTASVAALSLVGEESAEQSQSQDAQPSGTENPQDGLPPQFVPGLVKVVVLADGDYSVSLGKISLVIGSNMWLPGMVQWYLAAVSEGNYRFGSLPTDYERMIWDFLTYLEQHTPANDKNASEMEVKLAWQWAEWRRQVFKEHGTKEVLPWDYFQGLAKSVTVFYGKYANGDLDYSHAVKTLKHNASTLSIIPVQLPEETIAKSGIAATMNR